MLERQYCKANHIPGLAGISNIPLGIHTDKDLSIIISVQNLISFYI